MSTIELNPIGTVSERDGLSAIEVAEAYRPGLRGLDGFSHLIIVWGASGADEPEYRMFLDAGMPYRKVESPLGIFAARSPVRPNPLCISVVDVAGIDTEAGIIRTPYLDAELGTPVIDIKPYTPSIDRVDAPAVPDWCAHWPKDVETSGDFDWDGEFRF